ncbi:Sugar transporter protein [Marinobacterium lacunae]|uniref:Sugar transporter protein n=1 Tax=Marinobacterium lacunae TaxID=1232683 RepID=A0A081FZK1_9GAMM|nr:AraD1 family protein [Marinobacterium lacunae]KEA63956.1 Sugar transporter protein [Marinobacterium lacunae]
MRIVQISHPQGLRAAVVESPNQLRVVEFDGGTYALAQAAIAEGLSLEAVIDRHLGQERLDYTQVIETGQLLAPMSHPDPAHCLVSGTGLTHLGSASTRANMHAQIAAKDSELTDSMRMFKLGLDGGKPETGRVGAQPEWFYKGDGDIVVAPEAALPVPAFAEDAGEEPELVGLYLIAPDGTPWRVGFAVGNEFSDHVTERGNYLWLAHSKLRACSFGPELLLGELPADLQGESRIVREGEVIWRKPFLTGEANMAHSLANLEHHHFKYAQFRRPGDLHVHYFGTATLSFADGVRTQDGDRFEIELPALGRALGNPLRFADDNDTTALTVAAL